MDCRWWNQTSVQIAGIASRADSPARGSFEGLAMARDAAFEEVEVVADGHGEGEQFFEPLLGLIEFHDDAARFQLHAGRKGFKLLIHNGGGCFDEQLRLRNTFLPQRSDQRSHFPSALDLLEALVAFGDALEARNQSVAVGEAAGPDAVDYAGREDLLGAPTADAKEELDGRPTYIRKGMLPQLLDYVWQVTIPGRFGGHGVSLCYCAPAQNAKWMNDR
jgi:hypothetical protein